MIERREVGGAFWLRCNDYNVISCEFSVINITENLEYEFRVFAVNAAGRSEPSQCASPVKVCEVVGGEKPSFVRALINQGVPLGRSVTFECEASGKPVPRSRWMKNGREVLLLYLFHFYFILFHCYNLIVEFDCFLRLFLCIHIFYFHLLF